MYALEEFGKIGREKILSRGLAHSLVLYSGVAIVKQGETVSKLRDAVVKLRRSAAAADWSAADCAMLGVMSILTPFPLPLEFRRWYNIRPGRTFGISPRLYSFYVWVHLCGAAVRELAGGATAVRVVDILLIHAQHLMFPRISVVLLDFPFVSPCRIDIFCCEGMVGIFIDRC